MTAKLVLLCFAINSASLCSCWMYYETLKEFQSGFTNSFIEPKYTHSQYKYGDCERKDIKFYAHVHLDSLQFLGKLFVRGWLDVRRIPTCIIMRAKSLFSDLIRSTAYPFQICVPRIVYCHTHKRYRYYYYEWYIPYNYDGGMDWDIYFYGPTSMTW